MLFIVCGLPTCQGSPLHVYARQVHNVQRHLPLIFPSQNGHLHHDYGLNYVSDSSACFFIDSCVLRMRAGKYAWERAQSEYFGRRKWIFLNIGVVSALFFYLFCNFSYDTYIILPGDLLPCWVCDPAYGQIIIFLLWARGRGVGRESNPERSGRSPAP